METIQLTQPEIEVIKSDVSKMRQSLGDSEFELALQTALSLDNGDPMRLTALVLDGIDKHRKQFQGDFTHATSDAWRKVYQQAEDAAKRELLAGSKELAELNSLEATAAAAKQAADAKTASLNRLFADFQSLPGQFERLRSRMIRLQVERAELDEATLKKQFEAQYREYLLTDNVLRRTDSNHFAGLICRRSLRLEVIAEVEAETKAEVAALQKRNVELARALGLRKHVL